MAQGSSVFGDSTQISHASTAIGPENAAHQGAGVGTQGGVNSHTATVQTATQRVAAILQQVESGMMHALRVKEHRAVLQLHPPQLGRLHIELNVGSNHQVHAQFVADHPEVKQIIEGQLQLLKDQLQQQGFTLANVNVDVSGQQFQGRFEGGDSGSGGSQRRGSGSEPVESMADIGAAALASSAAAAVRDQGSSLSLMV